LRQPFGGVHERMQIPASSVTMSTPSTHTPPLPQSAFTAQRAVQ
jgi:hypothetical protein